MKVCKQGETGGEATVWLEVPEGRLSEWTLSPYEESRVRLALSSPQAFRAGPAAKTAIRRCAHTQEHVSLGSNVSLSPRDGVKVRVFYQPPSSWSQPDESLTATARTTSNTECLLVYLEGHNFTRSVPAPSSFLSLWLSSFPCARIAAQCFGDGREFGSLHHIRSLCRGGLVVTRWLVFSAQRGLDSLSIVPLPGRSRCRRLDSRVGSLRSRTEQEEGGRGTIESRARALHFPSSITRAAYARDHHLEGFKREEGEGGGPIG